MQPSSAVSSGGGVPGRLMSGLPAPAGAAGRSGDRPGGSDVTAPGDDTTAGVIGRLRGEFEGRLELAQIARVVQGCRTELTCSPPPALPELIERLAHQRLLDTAPRAASPHP